MFGCSFTNYIWPTWADFLSFDYDEYYNYGQEGAGNQFIFEQLSEAIITHDIDRLDTVIIMWSTYQRHDLYRNNKWVTPGNVLNAHPIYDIQYIEKYFDIKGSILHTFNFIHAAQQMLDNIGCKWRSASHQDMTMPLGEVYGTERIMRMNTWFRNYLLWDEFPELKKYKSIFEGNWIMPSLSEFRDTIKSPGRIKTRWQPGSEPGIDHHPTPKMHLDWLIHVGLHDNNGDDRMSKRLLHNWNRAFPTNSIYSGDGKQWCEENIPHVIKL